MNKVVLVGRIANDIDLHYTAGENAKANARFSVAVNRRFKNADGNYEADFIRCVAWDRNAEFISKWFHKGDMIVVEGNIRTGSFTNKDGQKVYTTDVYVDSVEFGGSKNSGNASASASQNQQNTNTDFMNIPDNVPKDEEELPW